MSIIERLFSDGEILYAADLNEVVEVLNKLNKAKFDSAEVREDGLWFLANGAEAFGPVLSPKQLADITLTWEKLTTEQIAELALS